MLIPVAHTDFKSNKDLCNGNDNIYNFINVCEFHQKISKLVHLSKFFGRSTSNSGIKGEILYKHYHNAIV